MHLFQADQYTRSCHIIQASLKRHIKRYFSNGLHTNTSYENSISRNPNIKGTITQVELVMNNYRGCGHLEKYPHENMDEHCKLSTFSILEKKYFLKFTKIRMLQPSGNT